MNKIIFSLVAVLFLGSCSSKFTLVKRKYNKGFYVSSSRDHGNKSHDQKLDTKTHKPTNAVVNDNSEVLTTVVSNYYESQKSSTETLNNTKNTLASSSLQNFTPAQAKEKTDHTLNASANKKGMVAKAKEFRSVVSALKKNQSLTKGSSSDNNLIIQIILCFLWWFNLLAVYLHDGKKITLNFWITLLLDFTFIGGVIFSLLVVLDVVNLA